VTLSVSSIQVCPPLSRGEALEATHVTFLSHYYETTIPTYFNKHSLTLIYPHHHSHACAHPRTPIHKHTDRSKMLFVTVMKAIADDEPKPTEPPRRSTSDNSFERATHTGSANRSPSRTAEPLRLSRGNGDQAARASSDGSAPRHTQRDTHNGIVKKSSNSPDIDRRSRDSSQHSQNGSSPLSLRRSSGEPQGARRSSAFPEASAVFHLYIHVCIYTNAYSSAFAYIYLWRPASCASGAVWLCIYMYVRASVCVFMYLYLQQSSVTPEASAVCLCVHL